MNESIYDKARAFKRKYPGTIAWRLKAHCKVLEKYINPGENVLFVFAGQKNNTWHDIFNTCVVVLTTKRILIGFKRVVFGYRFISITPDMFNDLTVVSRIFFGTVVIDTIKETTYVSNVSKKALDPIETAISEYMMKEKKKYAPRVKGSKDGSQ